MLFNRNLGFYFISLPTLLSPLHFIEVLMSHPIVLIGFQIPVTYAGGARTLEDLELVRVAGGGRVDITVGSALDIFGGELLYKEVVRWHNQQKVEIE